MHIVFPVMENLRVLSSIRQIVSMERVLSEPILYFKHMSESDSHFSKVRSYRSIWLYSIPCACMTCFVVLCGWSSLISNLWSHISSKTFSTWFWKFLRTILGCHWLIFLLVICYNLPTLTRFHILSP